MIHNAITHIFDSHKNDNIIDIIAASGKTLNITANYNTVDGGNAATPLYSFPSPTNDTGMYSSATDNIDFSTSSINRMNVSATGNVTIPTKVKVATIEDINSSTMVASRSTLLNGLTTVNVTALAYSGIAYGTPAGVGRFVMISQTSTIKYSADGITWSSGTISSGSWGGIAYSPELNLYVVISSSNFAYSSDGITFTNCSPSASAWWISISWSPKLGMFVAVSYNSTDITYSYNGINWASATAPSNSGWNGLCWSPELAMFVSTGNGAANATTTNIMYSTTGTGTWSTAVAPIARIWGTVMWCSKMGMFISTAYASSSVMYSTTGTGTWSTATNSSSANWGAKFYSSELGCAMVMDDSNKMSYTTDGINWSIATMPANQSWSGITSSPTRLLFCSNTGTNRVAYSSVFPTHGINLGTTTNTITAITTARGSINSPSFLLTGKTNYSQVTNNTTTVPVTTNSGTITTQTINVANNSSISFAVTSSLITASSLIKLTIESYSGIPYTNGYPVISVNGYGSGTASIKITNCGTNSMNGTITFNFIIY